MKNQESFKKLLPRERFSWNRLFQYFLQGLLVVAPLAITIYGIYWIVSSVDSWLPLFQKKVLEPDGTVKYITESNYGLGFVIIIVAIIIIGYLSSFFIQSRIFNLFDYWLEKTPGVKFIYSTVKDFFEAFAGEKKKFDKPVLANIDDNDVWRVGFITNKDMTDWGLKEYVAVYVPMAYSIAGNVYLIPATRVKPVTNVTSTEAMKFAISGGVTEKDDN